MREVIIRVRDDLDHSDADETISFTYRGVSYEIDLSNANVELFDKSMKQFIDAARTIKSEPKKKAKDPRIVQRRKIRQWASNNGFKVGIKGTIADPIIQAYLEAHPGETLIPDSPPEPVTAQQVVQAQVAGVPVAEYVHKRVRENELATKETRSRIRRWARKHMMEVRPTGIIPVRVADAYFAAHPEEEHLRSHVGNATGGRGRP